MRLKLKGETETEKDGGGLYPLSLSLFSVLPTLGLRYTLSKLLC